MNKHTFALFAAAVLGVVGLPVLAQDNAPTGNPPGAPTPNARPGADRPDHRNRPPRSPLEAALDANGDGIISAEEIANASAALRKLVHNHDGSLSPEDYRPHPPAGGPGAGGPRGPEGDREQPRHRPGGPGAPGERSAGGPDFGRGPNGFGEGAGFNHGPGMPPENRGFGPGRPPGGPESEGPGPAGRHDGFGPRPGGEERGPRQFAGGPGGPGGFNGRQFGPPNGEFGRGPGGPGGHDGPPREFGPGHGFGDRPESGPGHFGNRPGGAGPEGRSGMMDRPGFDGGPDRHPAGPGPRGEDFGRPAGSPPLGGDRHPAPENEDAPRTRRPAPDQEAPAPAEPRE